MHSNEKAAPLRMLVLITTPKLSEKAAQLFRQSALPMQYEWNAVGTAPSEMIDILGLGSPDKSILFTVLPQESAADMMQKLKKRLKLGAVDSGIAFTLPLTGANNLVVRMMAALQTGETQPLQRKDERTMAESRYSLVTVIVDQGYSEEVMDVARAAGAGGGTVVHGRRVGDEETMGFFGMSIQPEKEMILIVTENENKLAVMQAIGEKCGMHSEAKGLVVSLPIDTVIGLE